MSDALQKSGIIISINPPYTGMILRGEKPMEFRRKILHDLLWGCDTAHGRISLPLYLYETKNGGGCGKIIGSADVSRVYQVMYWTNGDGTNLAAARNACVKDLYYAWCAMHDKVPNTNEGWFKSARFKQYRESIGWGYSQDFDYAVKLYHIQAYTEPKDISEFLNSNGEPMVRPPHNMCYCYAFVSV